MQDHANSKRNAPLTAAQAARALTLDLLHTNVSERSELSTATARMSGNIEGSTHFTERDRSALRQNHAVPLYHQICQIIRTHIKSGSLGAGSQLPSDNRLASLFGVSRVTATRALRELAREGLIERRRGIGNRVIYVPPKIAGLELNADPFGRHDADVKVQVIVCEQRLPPIGIAADMPEGALSEAHFVARIMHNDDAPFCYQESWIAGLPDTTTDEDLTAVEYTSLLADHGVHIAGEKYSLSASMATMTTIDSLGLAFGDPVLCVTRRAYDDASQIVELSVFQYHGDSFQMVSA